MLFVFVGAAGWCQFAGMKSATRSGGLGLMPLLAAIVAPSADNCAD
jgi:hypothetical protein